MSSWIMATIITLIAIGLVIGFCLFLDYFGLVEYFMNFIIFILLVGLFILLIMLVHLAIV